MANMRPSWPPPRTPMIDPGGMTRLTEANRDEPASRDVVAELLQLRAQVRARRGENRDRQQAGIGGARRSDRHRRDRHAFRHLHDRQQRIEPVERRALHRHADHRQHRVGRHHAGQMRRAAGAGDDHLEPALRRAASRTPPSAPASDAPTRRGTRAATSKRVRISSAWRIVVPVRLAAHDDADQRARLGHPAISSRRRRRTQRVESAV